MLDKQINTSLEVGLAYGCSAAHIMTATKSKHYAIDPYQKSYYHSLGLENIKKLNLESNLAFENDFSHIVLPRLVQENVRLDFAFIDGGHRFDEIFLDFYYIDLLLNDQGYVLFHDSWLRATQLAASWVLKNRAEYHFMGDNENMILFKKGGIDKRNWMHFKEFYTLKSLISNRKTIKKLGLDKEGVEK
ncbi:MAG TPA: class I SAM-dependent methyltransferase [Bacillota bacterium]|nr:class I SAM-dependent methyltransferase [Bacillota bacterium]